MEPSIYTERLKALRKHLKKMNNKRKGKHLLLIEIHSNNHNLIEVHKILFPIWLLNEMPFIYIDYPLDEEEKNPVEIFIDFFDLSDDELIKYFNNVINADRMAWKLLELIAQRIYNNMLNH